MTQPIFTLANQLTLLRMLLIPVWVLLIVYGYFGWALADRGHDETPAVATIGCI